MSNKKHHKIGRIDISKLRFPPKPHELKTAEFYARRGIDVVFFPASNQKGDHRADLQLIQYGGMVWEAKSPTGTSNGTMLRVLRRGSRQSTHIIVDLRRTRLPDAQCIKFLKQAFCNNRKVIRLHVITKAQDLLDFKR